MNNLYRVNFSCIKNRGNGLPQKNKFSFKQAKANTIQSLTDVNYFFCNLNNLLRYWKLYNLLK